MGLLHHPFWLKLVLARLGHLFLTFENTFWLRITDEGSVPKMRIWSILLIKSDLKWCIHLSEVSFHISEETKTEFIQSIISFVLTPDISPIFITFILLTTNLVATFRQRYISQNMEIVFLQHHFKYFRV